MKTARIASDESGQSMLVTALCMVGLLGFVALAADLGILFRDKVNLQKVADAAAIAAATQIASGNYQAAAIDSAKLNGITNGNAPVGNGGVTATLGTTYHPSAVKVYVSQSEGTFFMRLFGQNPVPVGATAVAGITEGNACMYALYPLSKAFKGNDITMNGTGSLTTNCGIYDNGNLLTDGASGAVTATWIGVVGSYSGGDASPQPVTGIVPVPDPLAYWTAPTPAGACQADPKASSGTVQPGCYNGLTVSSPATLAAGLYIVRGTLSLTSVTASGVTFYIDGSNGGSLGGVSGVNLSAPTSGTSGTCTAAGGCNGILIWDTETNSPGKGQQGIAFGPGTATLKGILYFPNASLKFHGADNTTFDSVIVAAGYEFDGTVNLNNYVLSAGQQPVLQQATLLE